ncbi:uncharacterized protein PAC_13440 [Phialocephala subalpina]|uniref:Uncharacterized protein n=1 Tax=Phialocephala subalpina TaxID=576137 RepID=A0A1L7XEU2_9HELO|nr:uncharacterized protein PAC_13440 [Phialocephala subalpina]
MSGPASGAAGNHYQCRCDNVYLQGTQQSVCFAKPRVEVSEFTCLKWGKKSNDYCESCSAAGCCSSEEARRREERKLKIQSDAQLAYDYAIVCKKSQEEAKEAAREVYRRNPFP